MQAVDTEPVELARRLAQLLLDHGLVEVPSPLKRRRHLGEHGLEDRKFKSRRFIMLERELDGGPYSP